MSAPTAPVRGSAAGFYRNSGTYGSPTWVLILNCGDLDVTDAHDKVEVPLRKNSGWKLYIAGDTDFGIAFKMLYDPADTSQSALRTAYRSKAAIELLLLDGPVATAGSSGIRGTFQIFKFPRQEPLGPMMVEVEAAPTYAAQAPEVFTAA